MDLRRSGLRPVRFEYAPRMAASTERILGELAQVQRLRDAHAADPAQLERVLALKAYQSRRFAHTYADLLIDPRFGLAARFFLDELYGPFEFAARDAQFARVVPSVARLFPGELARTLEDLARLHALSERLDDDMARALAADGDGSLDAAAYTRAWQATGQPQARREQVTLTLGVGKALDQHTKSRLLRGTLHLMRAPARAAGLGALQHFLEAGFDAFARMKGADPFLELVRAREFALADALESAAAGAWSSRSRDGSRPPSGLSLEPLP